MQTNTALSRLQSPLIEVPKYPALHLSQNCPSVLLEQILQAPVTLSHEPGINGSMLPLQLHLRHTPPGTIGFP